MLLGILAIASVAVLVGGRMADQTRRVGLLKAVGGTPGLVAAVLLAEYLALALFAAGAGLGLGRLLAPEFTAGDDGLLGGVGTPVISAGAVGAVVGAAVLVAVFATFVPAVRAARMSTVRALRADARAPQRRRLLFAVSRHLPVPLLLGLRLTLRRPRRFVLGVLSVAVTASGVFAVLSTQTHLSSQRFGGAAGLDNPLTLALDRVTLVLSVLLCGLAAVNTVFIAWSAVLDARQATSLSRALGASSGQVTGALVSAQVFPSLLGVLLGIPLGGLLLEAVNKAGVVWPPAWTLVVLVVGTVAVTAALTAVPARRSARTALVWASSP
jgi:ABC-type antimicrobial peptide transport system permease subunit